MSAGDAVADATDDAAEEGGLRSVVFAAIEAEDDIGELAVAVGSEEADEGPPIVGNLGAHSGVIFESEEVRGATVRKSSERSHRQRELKTA